MISKRAIEEQIHNALPNITIKSIDLNFKTDLKLGLLFTRQTWMSHGEIVEILNKILTIDLMKNITISYYSVRSLNDLYVGQKIWIMKDALVSSNLVLKNHQKFTSNPEWVEIEIKSLYNNYIHFYNPLYKKDERVLSDLMVVPIDSLTIVLK